MIGELKMKVINLESKKAEYVEKSFDSIVELRNMVMKQKTLKLAMGMVDKINELNGYNVLGQYDIKIIEQYYEDKRKENVYKELQKGYMKMLSR